MNTSKVHKKKKIAVFTAIFGGYDSLKVPESILLLEEADFYCFTNDLNLKSNYYNIVYIEPMYKEWVRNSRRIKVLGHPILNDYSYTIWIDACFQLNLTTLQGLITLVSTLPLATFKHPERNCLFQEALACLEYKKDFDTTILYQMTRYYMSGMPKNHGLYETGILIRNMNSTQLRLIEQMWFKEINKGSRRDQLSLPFVLWKLNIKINIIDGHKQDNEIAFIHNHHFDSYKLNYKIKSISYSIHNYINSKFKFVHKLTDSCLKFYAK